MTLFRVVHNKDYTCINNYICTDDRLSWKAKGIWLYAFSRKDDWEFYLCDIVNQSTDGKESVRSGLKELEECGYLSRERIQDKEGKFGYRWTFFETPQKIFPQQENPPAVNTTLTSTEESNVCSVSEDEIEYIEKSSGQKKTIKKEEIRSILKEYGENILENVLEDLSEYPKEISNIFELAKTIASSYNRKIKKTKPKEEPEFQQKPVPVEKWPNAGIWNWYLEDIQKNKKTELQVKEILEKSREYDSFCEWRKSL